jgi:hypothetical protein
MPLNGRQIRYAADDAYGHYILGRKLLDEHKKKAGACLFTVDELLADREERNPTEPERVRRTRVKEQDLMGDVDMWEAQASQEEPVEEEDYTMMMTAEDFMIEDEELGIPTTTQDEELGILELLDGEEEEEEEGALPVTVNCENDASDALDSQRMYELRKMMR